MASTSGDPKDTEDWSVDYFTLRDISELIGSDYRRLSRLLGFSEPEINVIELDEKAFGVREVAYRILQKWKQREGKNATNRNLFKFLHQVDRKDIVDRITTARMRSEQSSSSKKQPIREKSRLGIQLPSALVSKEITQGTSKENQKVLCEVQTQLRELYKDIELKGLPWMEQTCITVCDYYVELLMIQQDRHGADQPTNPIQLNKIFDTPSTLGIKKSRILVEGGPGYGKTAFGYKLCFDFAVDIEYIKCFDLVLLLPLGEFSGDLDEMLIKTSGVCTSDAAQLLSILKEESTNILIILDGVDELPKEHNSSVNSLITGESFPHATVIITSRPGMFAIENENRLSKLITSCDAVIPTNLFNTRVQITGIPETKLDEFVEKYLTNFPPEEKTLVARQLKEFIQNNIASKSFLQCPLFVLMIIILLVDAEYTAIQSFMTKTELYKQVMNFVIRRYLTKNHRKFLELPDLFSVEFVQRNVCYVNLMIQFGQLSIQTLKSSNLSISRATILKHNVDGRILEIGLLNKCVSVKGFMNSTYYEPIHKSLMEFAAAYSLWTEFLTGNREQWEKNIRALRPKPLTTSSLVFPFLAGLMQQDACALFQALRPYAAEYSAYFGPLVLSLVEVKISSSFLSALLPFLATRWHLDGDWDDFFPLSPQQKAILDFGLKRQKIKQITWCANNVESLPDVVIVNTMELMIKNNYTALSDCQHKSITCTDLHCSLHGFSPSTFLSHISFIKFQRISLRFHGFIGLHFLYFFRSVTESVSLRDVSIHRISSNLTLENGVHLKMFANLIRQERVAALFIIMDPPPHALCPEQASPLQPHIDHLVTCASKSSVLLQFSFDNLQQTQPKIDLVQLCNKGQKPWEWIRLSNVQVHCTTELKNSKLLIQHLCISSNDHNYIESSLQQSCQIRALCYNTAFLTCVFLEHLSELSIVVNRSLFTTGLTRLKNLQILSLTVESFDYRFLRSSVDIWLLKLIGCAPNLRGLEICDIGQNYSLATELVRAVIMRLSLPQKNTSTSNSSCKLLYVMLSFGIRFEVEKLRVLDGDGCIQFILLISTMKPLLKQKLLSRLDTVVWGANLLSGLPTIKQDFSISLSNLFSFSEGFIIEHDFWGMRQDDSLRSRQLNDCFPSLYHRFSINYVGN